MTRKGLDKGGEVVLSVGNGIAHLTTKTVFALIDRRWRGLPLVGPTNQHPLAPLS